MTPARLIAAAVAVATTAVLGDRPSSWRGSPPEGPTDPVAIVLVHQGRRPPPHPGNR
jgi:hypothetical protein